MKPKWQFKIRKISIFLIEVSVSGLKYNHSQLLHTCSPAHTQGWECTYSKIYSVYTASQKRVTPRHRWKSKFVLIIHVNCTNYDNTWLFWQRNKICSTSRCMYIVEYCKNRWCYSFWDTLYLCMCVCVPVSVCACVSACIHT